MTSNVTLSAAALAGLLSFLSPCVLPLVPPYLTFIAGTGLEELAEGGERRAQRDTLIAAVLFVLGFSTVFVVLGATASALGQTVRQHLPLLSALAGVAIIGMGLHFLGVFRLHLLYREKRVSVEKPIGLWGAYVMGLAFAFGWTPCIGPILAAILAVASSEDDGDAWRGPARRLFPRPRPAFPAGGAGDGAVHPFPEALQARISARSSRSSARCWSSPA